MKNREEGDKPNCQIRETGFAQRTKKAAEED
jgi:hypothetical protein